MANDLNITPANFGEDSGKLFLHDPVVYLKFIDDTTDNNWHALGILKVEKAWSQKVEYATLQTGIPRQTIRKDVVSQEFSLEGAVRQLQPETVALLSQRKVIEETGSKRVAMGSGAPPAVFCAVELLTKTVDGKVVKLRIRRAQITAEDFSVEMGGSEHAEIPFKLEALKDPDPSDNNSEWDYDGFETVTGATTSSDATLSISSFGTVDDILIGGRITGDGIPADTTVLSVDYSAGTIEMSASATATDTGVTISVETESAAYQDNVAHWVFMD